MKKKASAPKSVKTNVIGIDIGGTKIAVCLANSQGQLIASERLVGGCKLPYKTAVAKLVKILKGLIQEKKMKISDFSACGISAPGPLDIEKGELLKSPNMIWDRVPIVKDIQKALGLPTFLENDANAGVLAEYYFGTARGYTDAIYLTMSTGIGAGVISNGQLIRGVTGIGTEVGHVVLDINGPLCGCGQRGCLEAYAGGRNVALRLQEKLRNHPNHALFHLPGVDGKLENLNFQVVRDGAKLGIPLACEMWDEICLRLAQGIGGIMTTFNPQIIILGTSAYYAGDFLLDPVKHYLPRFAWKEFRDVCKVCATELGPKVGELAGASVALYYVRQK